MALQGANNETGVIQPVAEAAALVHAADGFLFCDAVQMAGRMACDIAALGADALMLSAHKMGGLKGAGALVVARREVSLGAPLMRGGGQERGARAGTESVAAIAAFGAAARACLAELDAEPARLIALRDRLTVAVRAVAADAVVFAETAPRLPNTVCFAVPGVEAATLMIALDLAGIAVSSGRPARRARWRRRTCWRRWAFVPSWRAARSASVSAGRPRKRMSSASLKRSQASWRECGRRGEALRRYDRKTRGPWRCLSLEASPRP